MEEKLPYFFNFPNGTVTKGFGSVNCIDSIYVSQPDKPYLRNMITLFGYGGLVCLSTLEALEL